MSEIIKPAAVLLIITLIASALLGGVNSVTKSTITENDYAARRASMSEVLPEVVNDSFAEECAVTDFPGVTGYSEGYGADGAVGYAISAEAQGYGGMINIMIGVNLEGKITGVKLLSHFETPGLGANAASKDFTDLFIGTSGELKVVKAQPTGDSEIQAITSATITTNGFKNAVNSALSFFRDRLTDGGAVN